ncbi:MAG: twin-arginine translocase TatA/TatE family subunit [Rickettsiales bacterium]|jgi:TatA/E family protein of Tat protein translocase|nr:twin-arginine translocase TatA/TatE family subunit [Rickettsiales bacterium]
MRFGFWEIFLIVALVFLLFGANKFPSMMKNLAEGLNTFKKEIRTKPGAAAKAKKPAKKTAGKKK